MHILHLRVDPFRIRVRPELIRTEYVFDPSGFDPGKIIS